MILGPFPLSTEAVALPILRRTSELARDEENFIRAIMRKVNIGIELLEMSLGKEESVDYVTDLGRATRSGRVRAYRLRRYYRRRGGTII